MIVRFFVFSLIALGSLSLLPHPCLLAGLIVELPSTSATPLFNGSDPDDTNKLVSGLNFNFYSTNVKNLLVSENGNLKFQTESQDFLPTVLGGGIARIAPLWDDVLMDSRLDNRIVAEVQAGRWLAVTWENIRLHFESVSPGNFVVTTRTVQAVIFESDLQHRGFDFKRNDIAFGYKPHRDDFDFGDQLFATVGLNSGTGSFTALPGSESVSGRVRGSAAGIARNDSLLAWEPDSFILFRPNAGLTAYTSTKEFFITAVPEPSAAILVIVAFGCMACSRVRRA